jgi:hypothetical protein
MFTSNCSWIFSRVIPSNTPTCNQGAANAGEFGVSLGLPQRGDDVPTFPSKQLGGSVADAGGAASDKERFSCPSNVRAKCLFFNCFHRREILLPRGASFAM